MFSSPSKERKRAGFNDMLTVQSHSPPMPAKLLQAFNQTARDRHWQFQCSPAAEFRQNELDAALAVWRERARGREMPMRADLTARAMKPFLTHMSLLERVKTDLGERYRIRLHGSALARYSGDATGKFLEQMVEPERIDAYRTLYDTLIAWRAPLRVVSEYQAREIDYLTGETLLAPLAVPESEIPLILSITYAKPRSEADLTPVHALLQRKE